MIPNLIKYSPCNILTNSYVSLQFTPEEEELFISFFSKKPHSPFTVNDFLAKKGHLLLGRHRNRQSVRDKLAAMRKTG